MTRLIDAVDINTDYGPANILRRQRWSFLQEGIPSPAAGLDRLAQLAALLSDHVDELVDSMTVDFGSRPVAFSMSGDIVACQADIHEQRRHLRAWVKDTFPSKASRLVGFHASVRRNPLGVIGPWTFPLQLSLTPAAAALAAGNRVMVRTLSRTTLTKWAQRPDRQNRSTGRGPQ
ncbi:hypothetical protein BOO86_21530 [Mycobacterium sp. CBMA 234]|uniref:aldehyde dehydrogenase family protein n=1 Tax=Mycolicibacterium sp. CBMA 234 TaxID=1918495 RepID=UPI0012DDA3DB|nr:aldehyde dehydrogenase family protein [Mycolicibacterium sp. CBMA 234]MUL67069.1 hypothetical protein [Mycolicibacterium sp. CBMA 234]